MDNSDFGKIDFSFPFNDCTQFHSQGGTSDCYKVRINGKWHFLKRPKKELNRNPFYLSAFEKEFDLGFNLEHPNIVRYINKGKDEAGTYFITEFIDGLTLDEFTKQNPDYFKQKQYAEKFINQLLSAISYLHSKQILHLDLKPQNILITHIDHHVKLIDLGFSYSDCHQTLTIGKTDLYAAPEQINNGKIDQRTDIYGFGMILLYVFTQTSDIKSLSKIPSNYRHIIRKCLSDSIEDRYFDIASLKKEIAQLSKNKSVKYWWLLLVVLCVGLFFLIKPYFEREGEVQDEPMVVSETNNEGSKEIQDSVSQKPTISEIREKPSVAPIRENEQKGTQLKIEKDIYSEAKNEFAEKETALNTERAHYLYRKPKIANADMPTLISEVQDSVKSILYKPFSIKLSPENIANENRFTYDVHLKTGKVTSSALKIITNFKMDYSLSGQEEVDIMRWWNTEANAYNVRYVNWLKEYCLKHKEEIDAYIQENGIAKNERLMNLMGE